MFNAYKTPNKNEKFISYIKLILGKIDDNSMTFDTGGREVVQDFNDFVTFLKENKIACVFHKGERHYGGRPRGVVRGGYAYVWDVGPCNEVNATLQFQYSSKNDLIDALNKLPLNPPEVSTEPSVKTNITLTPL